MASKIKSSDDCRVDNRRLEGVAPALRPDPAGVRAALGVSPEAWTQTIMCKVARRPLWPVRLVEDFFDQSGDEVRAKIKTGHFPWVFDIGTGGSRRDYRILAWCVLEKHASPFNRIGATRNLQLAEVIDFILPRRDIRSTELARIFSCSRQHIFRLAKHFTTLKRPDRYRARQGYAVFSRLSVAQFLEQRRLP